MNDSDDIIQQLRSQIETIESDHNVKNATYGASHRSMSFRPSSKKKDSSSTPFSRIVRLSAVRERSSMEMRRRLVDEQYAKDQVDEAVQRAISCGLIDDMRYADLYVRSKIKAGKGALKIQRDLERLGIYVEHLEGWPERYQCDEESQLSFAHDLLMRHPPHARDAWGAAYRKVLGRGYTSAVATRAARIWAESQKH